MPLGLTNVPTIFIDYMTGFLDPFLDKFVVMFIDDILIYFKTQKEHEEHLRIVLHILKEKHLYAKLEKCDFWLKEVKFLGYVINENGMTVDPKKVEAILSQEWLKTVIEIRRLLGLTRYY